MSIARRCNGFTLVELLVVIAVIGLLISLLLPALQIARASARKTQCANNLKQIGLALHTYMTAHQSFPPGYISRLKDNADDDGPGLSWGSMLLPNLEQAPLAESIHFDRSVTDRTNDPARMVSLPAFICPHDTYFERVVEIPDRQAGYTMCRMAGASYVGSAGSVHLSCTTCRDQFDGVFGRNKAIATRHIRDGLSQTLAVGERSFNGSSAVWFGVATGAKLVDRVNPSTYAAAACYVLGSTFKPGYNIPPSTVIGDVYQRATGAHTFGSLHDGGIHFAFCDGSVQFLDAATDPGVMNRLSSRAGGESRYGTIGASGN